MINGRRLKDILSWSPGTVRQIWYVPSPGVSQGSAGAAGVESLTEVQGRLKVWLTPPEDSLSCPHGIWVWEDAHTALGFRERGYRLVAPVPGASDKSPAFLGMASLRVWAHGAWHGPEERHWWWADCLGRDGPEQPSQQRCLLHLWFGQCLHSLLRTLSQILRKIMFGKIQLVSLKV